MHVARLSILQMSIAFDSYRTRQLLVLSSQTVSYVRFRGEKRFAKKNQEVCASPSPRSRHVQLNGLSANRWCPGQCQSQRKVAPWPLIASRCHMRRRSLPTWPFLVYLFTRTAALAARNGKRLCTLSSNVSDDIEQRF